MIALTNSKGGVGKSTLAVHLAVWLKEQGFSVALIDADVQHSSSRWLSRLDPSIPIQRLHTPDDIIEQAPEMKANADYVVADGPAGMAEVTRAILLVADRAIIPLGPSALDLFAAEQSARVVAQAQQIRGGLPEAFLLLNRVQSRTRLAKEAVEAVALLGLPVARKRVHLRTAYADASGQNTVVWRMPAAREAAVELKSVFGEMMDHGEKKLGGDLERASAAVS